MKVRLIQFSPNLGDVERNLDFHKRKTDEAKNDGIDLLIFPELSVSGYQMKDIVYDIAIKPDDDVIGFFKDISKDIAIIAGMPYEEKTGIIYNAALCFDNGDISHIHRKVQLPNFGMFEEKMIFKGGDRFKSFMIGDMRVGILICREILFPVNAYLYYLQDTDLLIGISNSPHRGMTEKGYSSHKLWKRSGEVFSINFHQHYVFVNRTGFEDGIGFGGGSFYSSPGIGIKNSAKYYEDDVIDIEINRDNLRPSRISSNFLRDEMPMVVLNELKRIIDV